MDYKAAEAAAAKSGFNDFLLLVGGNAISLLQKFGLLFDKTYPQIGKAETLSMLVNVPGASRPLDLSRSIDGKLHYKSRKITVRFSCFRPQSEDDGIQKGLEKLLQGQWVWFKFRDDSFFWRGHTTVNFERKANKAAVTITAVCNPYKYNLTAYLGNDWLWDTFNFETDTIYTERTEVKRL